MQHDFGEFMMSSFLFSVVCFYILGLAWLPIKMLHVLTINKIIVFIISLLLMKLALAFILIACTGLYKNWSNTISC